MYPQPGAQFDPSSAYAAQANAAAQRPSPSLAHPTYAPLAQQQQQQQQQAGMAAYANAAYGGIQQQQQQANGMVNPAMYGQPGGGGAGANPSFASSSSVFGGGAPGQQAPYSPAQQVSTAALLQQQLAQQAAMSQGQGQANPHASPYQNQQQAYNQMQQSRQQQGYPPTPQNPPFVSSSYPQQPPPPSAPTPSQPPPAAAAPQPRPQMSMQDLQNALRGVQLAGMTPERFNQLTPLQQQALREYMQRSRAQQQAQLGLGMPSSPASNVSTPSKAAPPPAGANGSPAPSLGAAAGGAPPRLVGAQAPTTDQQREGFFRTLSEFYNKRGQAFPTVPAVDGRQLDLTALFAAVSKAGGSDAVNKSRWWGYVASALGYQAPHPTQHPESRLQSLTQAYQQVLFPFEQAFNQMQQLKSAQAAAAAAAARAGTAPPMNGAFAAPSPAPTVLPTASSLPPGTPSAAPSLPNPPAAAAPSPFATAPTPSASASAKGVIDLTTAAPSPAATATSGLTRPTTAVSQGREGTAPPGTAGGVGGGPPPFGADVKGKGKAVEESVKVEPGLPNGASPAARTSATPHTSTGALPDASSSSADARRPSTSSSAVGAKPVEPPAEPPRRKRRKIEYAPLSRPVETYGGYELGLVEQTMARVEKVRRPRGLHDLGTVDIHSLTMQLRCRLPAEVSYALNALALIALHMSFDDGDSGVPFPLSRCPDLVEELLDLVEETAFGAGDVWEEKEDKAPNPPLVDPPASYRDLFRLVADDANKLVPPSSASDPSSSSFEATRPAETVLSVLNLLRNFAQSQKNASVLGADPRVLDILARVSALPLKPDGGRGSPPPPRYPLHVTPADSLAIKKDVLETVNTFGLDVRLAEQSASTAQAVVDLVVFFLRDAHHHDQLYFDLSSTPSVLASRHAQPPSLLIPPYLELGLSTFSRIALLDSNRSTFARLIPPATLYTLFESLTFLLPVSEADFQLCTFEAGLVHTYHIALGLYNLAFVAPPSVKLRLRTEPRFVKSLVRVVRRLAGTAVRVRDDDLFVGLAQRCIGVLQLLSSLGGVSTLSTSAAAAAKDGSGGGTETSEVPWWGLSMSGDAGDDSDSDGEGDPLLSSSAARPRGLSLRPPAPPGAAGSTTSAAGGGAGGEGAGPPILAGDARALWELLAQGSMALVFAQLVELADATTGRRKRRRKGGVEKGKKRKEEGEGEKVEG
ncbi:hypothetical protein JCM6882_005666 [Rhodosporidiobolus microsporus]